MVSKKKVVRTNCWSIDTKLHKLSDISIGAVCNFATDFGWFRDGEQIYNKEFVTLVSMVPQFFCHFNWCIQWFMLYKINCCCCCLEGPVSIWETIVHCRPRFARWEPGLWRHRRYKNSGFSADVTHFATYNCVDNNQLRATVLSQFASIEPGEKFISICQKNVDVDTDFEETENSCQTNCHHMNKMFEICKLHEVKMAVLGRYLLFSSRG